MVGSSHEEHDKEDPKVIFSQLEKSIATLTELVMQLLVKKDREANSIETEHEEDKAHREDPMYNDSCKNHVFFFIFHIPFKVEEKLEIPMYDGQINVEVLNSWLKQMEVYFGLYQIQETQQIFFSMFEDDQTCSIVVGELCGCIEDRQESHDYEMGGLQGITEVTILSHRL
jgi:hypothetical protein